SRRTGPWRVSDWWTGDLRDACRTGEAGGTCTMPWEASRRPDWPGPRGPTCTRRNSCPPTAAGKGSCGPVRRSPPLRGGPSLRDRRGLIQANDASLELDYWRWTTGLRLFVRRVGLLRRLELHLDGPLFLVDVEDLAEGLVALGDDLDLDLALRDGRDVGDALHVGLELVVDVVLLAELHVVAAFDEGDDDAGAFEGLVLEVFHLDGQLGHRMGCKRGRESKREGCCEKEPEGHKNDYPTKATPVRRPTIQAMSGSRYRPGRPRRAETRSAAMWPLRTAPSMVEGQPERVQSPASVRLAMGVAAAGRNCSKPGRAEKVARTSLTTWALTSLASRTAGRNSASSRRARSMIAPRLRGVREREALTTNCR